MLLFSRQLSTDLTFAAWQIREEEAYFRTDLPLSGTEEAELARHHVPIRRLEWLAGRWLLHRLTGATERLTLGKNPYAKPFFLDYPDQHCSLSHSQGTVAALLSERPCGCDIQVLVEKMTRLAPKFMRPEEFEFVRQYPQDQQLALLHVFWTAKEALYKAHGLKELDFRAHLRVEPFDWRSDQEVSTTRGHLEKGDLQQVYQLHIGHFRVPDLPEFVWTVATL
jgi:phosphopantetheinyl transferase